MDERVYDLTEKNLNKTCELRLINLASQPFIHPSFDAIIMVKPTQPLTDFQKLTIDQYIQHGGKVIFTIDKLEAEMDSLQLLNQVIAYDRQLGISDLLFRYGVRMNNDLLMDLQCDYLPFDVNGNGQYELLPWNYFPVLESAENHPINKNLGFVSGRFVNTLDTVSTQENIKKTILLWSSVNSRSIASPARISGEENSTAPDDAKYQSKHLPAAVLLEGNFSSYFARRLSQEFADSLQKLGMPFLSQSNKPAALMVVADGDIFLNDITKDGPLPMGMNRFTLSSAYAFPFANREFLQNTLEYFMNRDNLIEAKSKEVVPRLLDMKRIRTDNSYILLFNIVLPLLLTLLFAFVLLKIRSRIYQ
jgi:gliding-associated putative ABC transporter substrate-binding component GldG